MNNTEQHRTIMDNNLNFINRVEMIEAEKLSSSIFIPGVGVYLNTPLTFQKLETIGLSSLEFTDKIENKSRIVTQKLTSSIYERFPVGNQKYCFLLTTASGRQYLIGGKDRPYPLITFTDSRPDNAASKCAVTMLVTYSNLCFYEVLG